MDWQGTEGVEREGERETYGEEDTIRNGEVSLNACAVAARAASARIVHFIIAVIDAVPRL
jgi:hypothetical protein